MNEIDELKAEAKEELEYGADVLETYSAETVEYLKIEEDEIAEPAPERSTSFDYDFSAVDWPELGIIAFLTWIFTGSAFGLGSFWAFFLLLPMMSNWKTVQADSDSGTFDHGTHQAVRGVVMSVAFMGMILFNAWGLFFPILLIGWGISMLWSRKLEENAVITF